MEEEIDLAGDFGAAGTVEPEVHIEPEVIKQEPAAPDAPRKEEDHGRVPLSELLSERRERQALQRRLDELSKPKTEPTAKPDFWENPENSVRNQAQEITNQALSPVQQSLMFNNRLVASSVPGIGKEAVDAAEVAFNQAIADGKMDPATHARINNHPNPFFAAVEWHRQQQVLEKTGGDLTAYEQKLLDEKLKDPEFLAKAVAAHQATQQQTRTPSGQFGAKPTTIIRPPSLNRATGSSNASAGDDTEEDMASAFGAR
jgi:hypothetical protein